jgi:hypothetical protein
VQLTAAPQQVGVGGVQRLVARRSRVGQQRFEQPEAGDLSALLDQVWPAGPIRGRAGVRWAGPGVLLRLSSVRFMSSGGIGLAKW